MPLHFCVHSLILDTRICCAYGFDLGGPAPSALPIRRSPNWWYYFTFKHPRLVKEMSVQCV